MRVLLDECVPQRLQRELAGIPVSTVQDQGWTSQRNGDLLRAMRAAGFTIFVTMDRNLVYQQNVAAVGLAVIVLRARSNRLQDLLPLVPQLRAALADARAGQVTRVAV